MRASLPALLALAVLPAFAAGSAGPQPSVPRSVASMRFALRSAEERLTALVNDSKVTPELRKINVYKGYNAQQLADAKKDVNVRALLKIATDEDVDSQVREEAANAIVADNALRFDGDLTKTEGRRLERPRAAFSVKVVPLLSNVDTMTRGLAKRILEGLWPEAKDPAIRDYDPRKKETWGKAREEWGKFLNK